MSSFTSPLKVELIGNNRWKTISEFEYHINTYPSSEVIVVPSGYITDFATIPRIFWPIIAPVDNHAKAAIVHDYLYSVHMYTRKKSDEIFKESLYVLRVNPIKIFILYWFVRVFGFSHWTNPGVNNV